MSDPDKRSCPSCGLRLDATSCTNCGTERLLRPWDPPRPPAVAQGLTARVLERDGHRCRKAMPDGGRCPETSGLVVHHLDDAPLAVALTDRLIAICRDHLQAA
jgi:hypothetical protein